MTRALTLSYGVWFAAGSSVGKPEPDRREDEMLAALNMGLVGTIIVIALIVAVVLFFMRRA